MEKKNKTKNILIIIVAIFGLALNSCDDNSSSGGSSSGSNNSSSDYTESRVVTSESYVDGNGEVSFRGAPMKTVWKNKYRNGHQFRATIKSGHNVINTTKCDYCEHAYYVHYDE